MQGGNAEGGQSKQFHCSFYRDKALAWRASPFLYWMHMLGLVCLLLAMLGNERFCVNINDKKAVQP